MTYKLHSQFPAIIPPGPPYICVVRDEDSASIPFDKANRDCVQFLEEWQAGIAVLDPNDATFLYTPENLALLGLEEKETAS